MWDLSVELRGIIKAPFEPVLLVAITTARRIELQALSVREPFLKMYDDRVVLQTGPGFTPKVASTFHKSQDIVLPPFCSSMSNSKEQELNQLDV